MVRVTADAKQVNRARLLWAAAEQFALHGIEGANVNEISLAAGFAKGTVYNYFPSKEALFLAVVEEGYALTERSAEPLPDAPTAIRLEHLLAADVEWVRDHEPFARVLARETLNPDSKLYSRIVKAAAPLIDRVVGILKAGVDRNEVRADMPVERLALVFLGLGELALVQHWNSGGTWPGLQEIPAFVTELFLAGAGR
ncbi:TetR/AcrR family transcriptional regulator [Mycobacterium intracellulare]|uniref:TetR family transcriptional regulator n=1 Tax=Mycobacterium intracellulare subsp. chimaera TaxID=222805 RepID=A0A220XUP6_MYCIT|nr:TetR/AcrR family transcriptional regulator [Mycobacterium intracellulare]ASL09519.1 TetR family transcriptional regulator [Mycobacterium intracellulare subsp. chimaera]ASL15211.1 TetR family transcriptional regulator [Mycobacterium intracellulare subsp. chimaera]ASL21325.1 TetR family transcriptional regulator [Mycobacterium intracellulare subsp. chimaera]ASQ86430.1 TetR family transcriptional regulator [Mycobacterium intracellulare subsp. chimaera]MCA2312049.1 TetR/AcrR family transcriptio